MMSYCDDFFIYKINTVLLPSPYYFCKCENQQGNKLFLACPVGVPLKEGSSMSVSEIRNLTSLFKEDMINCGQDPNFILNAYAFMTNEANKDNVGWIKTDDYQYAKEIGNGYYHFFEARYIEDDRYLLCENIVDIKDYVDKDGFYTDDCKSIINAYYGNEQDFDNAYTNKEYREQVLAEMIFEETPYYDCKHYQEVNSAEINLDNVFSCFIHNIPYNESIETSKIILSDIDKEIDIDR